MHRNQLPKQATSCVRATTLKLKIQFYLSRPVGLREIFMYVFGTRTSSSLPLTFLHPIIENFSLLCWPLRTKPQNLSLTYQTRTWSSDSLQNWNFWHPTFLVSLLHVPYLVKWNYTTSACNKFITCPVKRCSTQLVSSLVACSLIFNRQILSLTWLSELFVFIKEASDINYICNDKRVNTSRMLRWRSWLLLLMLSKVAVTGQVGLQHTLSTSHASHTNTVDS